jgi:hypothetical protein
MQDSSYLRVHRSTVRREFFAPAFWNQLATVAASSTSYKDLSVAPGTQYCYRVQACGNGCTDYSNQACASTPRLPGDLNNDNRVDCSDLNIVLASFGKKAGDPGFDPRADVAIPYGIVDIRDLAWESRLLPLGLSCR